MFPEVRSALTGRGFQTFPAVLSGYRRLALFLAGRAPVPGIVAEEEASVSGLVLRGVDSRSLQAFDTFEGVIIKPYGFELWEGVKGGLYDRERVAVRDGEGRSVQVLTYVSGPAVRGILKGEWDPEIFRKRHLPAYRGRLLAARRK